MFQAIWEIIAIPLGFIMRYCYLFVNDVLKLPLSYVWALFLFALVTKALLFPLTVRQQRSTARMAAYNPMIQEIQAKYKNNPQKAQEEVQKFQQEHGYSMMSGCLPSLIQFPIIFGLVEVIYKPLTYMIRIPADIINSLTETVSAFMSGNGLTVVDRYLQTNVIEYVKTNPGIFNAVTVEGFTGPELSGYLDTIARVDMSIGSINLWETPKLEWSLMLLIPIFSIVTMLLASLISQKLTGTNQGAQGNTMLITNIMMSVLFAVFSFSYPAGFSLYWGFQNLIGILQSFIVRKIVNVDKIKEEIQAQVEESKKKKKEKKKVKVIDEKTGETVEKTVSQQELARIRLQKARELDDERYNNTEE